MAYDPDLVINAPVGVTTRKGIEVVAEFDNPVDELKMRNGRLTAKVNGIWHIVPTEKTAVWVPKERA